MSTDPEFSRFGPYLIVRTSGSGGMGRVQLALRTDGEEPDLCVLKRMRTEECAPEQGARFEREARIAARLSHENIARTLRVETIDGELCLAQEFVDGTNVARFMRQAGARGIPAVGAAHIVREVASALTYAHEFGGLEIVHRDVTPENVMLSWAGDVKLIDFGIARSTIDGTLTSLGMVVGRRAYMAPEVWAGEKPDRRADVFALGVVLWELLTARRLEELDEALWRDAVPDPRTVRADIPAELAEVAMRALAPKLAERYQTAAEVREALAAFVDSTEGPKTELAKILAFYFNVAQAKEVVGGQIADAREVLRANRSEARGRFRRAPKIWITAAAAAVVLVSGIAISGLRKGAAPQAKPRLEPRVASSTPARPTTIAEAPNNSGPALSRPAASVAPAASGPRNARRPVAAAAGERSRREPTSDELLRSANDRFDDGHAAEATALARRAVAAGAGAPAHALLGYISMSRGNLANAERELAEAVRMNPRDGEAAKRLADVRRARAEQGE